MAAESLTLTIKLLTGLSIQSGEKDWVPDEYEFVELISYGDSVVCICRDKNTKETVAVKREFLPEEAEIVIVKTLPRNPCIVELKKVTDDADEGLFVAMESMDTHLYQYMKLTEKPLTPSETKDIMPRILDGVRFLHENGVMHADLEPSNILVNHKNKFEVKIGDFNCSTRFGPGQEPACGLRGTSGYMAPEVLVEGSWPYTCAVDMWSVRCVMVELVWKQVGLPTGALWGSDEIECIQEKLSLIRDKMEVVKDSVFFTPLSPTGLNLLEKLLEMDPNKRITAVEALLHPWFEEV